MFHIYLLILIIGVFVSNPVSAEMGFKSSIDEGLIDNSCCWQDPETNLLWLKQSYRAYREHHGGTEPLNWQQANDWIKELNAKKVDGYDDWRLPSIEEYATVFREGEGAIVYEYRSVEQTPLYDLGYRRQIEGKGSLAWSREEDEENARCFNFVNGETKSYPKNIEMTYEFDALAVRGPIKPGE